MTDVSAWLRQLGLSEYVDKFAANHIDAETLPQLTADDLREIGVTSVGHRRRLLEAIAALAAGPAPAPSAPPATSAGPPAQSQRRPVAVMFADLCGYTAMSRALPDEVLHALVDRYLALAGEIVRRHGGTVDKHIGDSVMALFGAPIAHGDDTLRAARAALELVQAMPGLSQSVGRTLEAHIGIAAGDVIVAAGGDGGWSAVGETVNLAARLTSLAPPGEVYASDAVQRAITARVACESRGQHEVKGFATPVAVWRLAELRDANATTTPATPFVGRTAELSQVTALLDTAQARGSGGVVYLRGEPGIGKSRLVAESRALAAARGMPCHVAHVLEFGSGHMRDPLRRLADSLLGLPPEAAPALRAEALAASHGGSAVEPRLDAFLAELAEVPLSSAQRAVLDASDEAMRRNGRRDALALLVERALTNGPFLLVTEDLHWADDTLVQGLLRLLQIAAERPLVAVLTSRPENERLVEALRQQATGAPLLTVDLAPLRPTETALLAGSFASLPAATVQRCLERAGGNPLFLEQLLQNAVEASGELPTSLRSLVVARVDRLDPADRVAVHAASVLGQRFDAPALRAALGDPGYQPAGLLRAGLLRADGEELQFAHGLLQESIYRSLLADTRRKLHGAAAAWFDGRDPLLRANHLDRAESPDAAEAYRIAAEDRLQRYRPAEALPLVERGLALAQPGAAQVALLLLQGDVLLDTGRAREALAAYGRAATAAGDPRQRCMALIGSAASRRIIDELDAAMANLAEAQPIAEQAGWHDLVGRCHFIRGNLCFPLGRVEECLAEHGAALALAERTGNAEAKARALGGLGDAEYARGRSVSCARHFQACVEESRRIGLGRVEVSNLPMYAHALLFGLRLQESRDAAEQSIALAIATGQKRGEMIARHAAVAGALELGQPDAGRPHLLRLDEIVRELEAWRFAAENLCFLAEIEHDLGNAAAVRPLLDEALGHARRTTMNFWGPALLAFMAQIEPDAGAQAELIAECETLLAGKALAHNHYLARRHLIELGLLRGDPEVAEMQCARLEEYYAAEPMPFAHAMVRRGRVLAAALRGRSPEMAAEAQALRDELQAAGAVRLMSGLEAAQRRLAA